MSKHLAAEIAQRSRAGMAMNVIIAVFAARTGPLLWLAGYNRHGSAVQRLHYRRPAVSRIVWRLAGPESSALRARSRKSCTACQIQVVALLSLDDGAC